MTAVSSGMVCLRDVYTYAFLALVFLAAFAIIAAGGPPILYHGEPMGWLSQFDPRWLTLYHAATRSFMIVAIAWFARHWALRNYATVPSVACRRK